MEGNKRTYSRLPNSTTSGSSSSKLSSSGSQSSDKDDVFISKVVLNGSPQIKFHNNNLNGKRLRLDSDSSSSSSTPTTNDKNTSSKSLDKNNVGKKQLLVPKKISLSTPTTPTSNNRLPEIDKQSSGCLDPGRMLNDTVVEFYLNYLLDKIQATSFKEKFHLFSTFFYQRIKTLQNSGKCMDRDQSIMRWDKNVKIFDKDYIVIPICHCKHWILVIVCFAYKLPPVQENSPVIDVSKFLSGGACMLIFDSLGYKYLSKFTEPIRTFLALRWQYERPKEERRNFKDTRLFREISTKVPRQRNTYDCGIYLLHYFEKFLSKPLLTYSQIVRECKDLSFEWSVNAKLKRDHIRNIVILHGQSASTSSSTSVETSKAGCD